MDLDCIDNTVPPQPRAASKHSPVEEWNVDDVCERLASCTWASPAFRHKVRLHRIDGRALTELTKEDLQDDFGVTELGQVKSILRHIGHLRQRAQNGPKLHSLLASQQAEETKTYWARVEDSRAGKGAPALELLQNLMDAQEGALCAVSPTLRDETRQCDPLPLPPLDDPQEAAATTAADKKPADQTTKVVVVGKPTDVRALRGANNKPPDRPKARPLPKEPLARPIPKDPLAELFSELPPADPVLKRRPVPVATAFSDGERVKVSQNNITLSGAVTQPLAPLKRTPPAPQMEGVPPHPAGNSVLTKNASGSVTGASPQAGMNPGQPPAAEEIEDVGNKPPEIEPSRQTPPGGHIAPLEKLAPEAEVVSPEQAVRETMAKMATEKLERHMVPYRPGILELERRFKEVDNLFQVWDSSSNISIEGSGYIEQSELRDVLSHFYGWTEEEKGSQTNNIMQEIDLNGDGQLDKDEFHRYMSEMTWSKTPSEFDSLLRFLVKSVSETSRSAEADRRKRAISTLFKAWDWNQSGAIDSEELRTVMVRYNDWSQRQGKHSAALILNEKDENRDDELDYDEFLDLFLYKTEHMLPDEFDFMVFRILRCVQDLQEDQRVTDINEFKPLVVSDLDAVWSGSGPTTPLILYGTSVDPAMQVEKLGIEHRVPVRSYLVQHEKSEKVALKEMIRWGMGRGQWIYMTLHHSYVNLDHFLRLVGVHLRQRATYLVHKKFRLWVMVNTTRYIRLPEIIRLNATPVSLDAIRQRRIEEYKEEHGRRPSQPPNAKRDSVPAADADADNTDEFSTGSADEADVTDDGQKSHNRRLLFGGGDEP
eukprot:TRINITY_DN30591_c0_g1_i1.p1 TRINITY_DN30591_c0_g1~~TRINITY_DN30591_c0_g1_i1.p1  ORF type:complete len:824 (+),score=288.14 TRINITY_DN30591_c0_g1_i1:60-2531(+)